MSDVALSIAAGWLLGVIFTAFRLPLPVPPLLGLVAAAAVLGGQYSFEFVSRWFFGGR